MPAFPSDRPTKPFVNIELSLVGGGASGRDDAPENPLARATRRLLRDGQRSRASGTVIMADTPSGALAWFGIFVLTEAGRVLCFPGFPRQYDIVRGSRADGRARFERALPVDHLTLELDRRTWHLTGFGRRQHQGGGRTRDVGEARVLWFCATARGISEFREAAAKTAARAECPSNGDEVQDRLASFRASVQKTGQTTLNLPQRPPGEFVLHIGVTVGPPGTSLYTGQGMPFPDGHADVTLDREVAAKLGTLPSHNYRVALDSDVELQVLALWMPGTAPSGAIAFSYPLP